MITHMCVCFLLYFRFLVGLDYKVQEHYYFFFPDVCAVMRIGAVQPPLRLGLFLWCQIKPIFNNIHHEVQMGCLQCFRMEFSKRTSGRQVLSFHWLSNELEDHQL